MLKRIIFLIVYALCLPLAAVSILATVVLVPVGIVMYIIRGDNGIDIFDFIFLPVEWTAGLPYKIMGED